ncbi:MAG: hypothetical protein JNM12_14230 [Alphaproteobacteria bacterium]|nr:hypothetical protein [Alphaproteobacteria bacterium]
MSSFDVPYRSPTRSAIIGFCIFAALCAGTLFDTFHSERPLNFLGISLYGVERKFITLTLSVTSMMFAIGSGLIIYENLFLPMRFLRIDSQKIIVPGFNFFKKDQEIYLKDISELDTKERFSHLYIIITTVDARRIIIPHHKLPTTELFWEFHKILSAAINSTR